MPTIAQLLRLLLLALVINALATGVLCAGLDVFASFEDPAEVSAVRGSNGVKLSASKRFPAWDGNSLEAIFPAGGGRIELTKIPADWRRQESLLIFVWGVQPAELRVTLLDAQSNSFNQTFPIRTGVNHLQLRLARAKSLSLGRMRSLSLETSQGGTFYFDYFALDRFHPVLEQRGRWDIDYSMEVETPHTAWARPFAGKRIKVWALAEVADGRGIVELAQRLEMDFRATSIGRRSGVNKWGFGDFYEHRSNGGEDWKNAYSLAHSYIADDLLNGPAYDVIIWPGIHPWESYPIEIRNEIRRRVERGAGLVLFYPNSKSSDSGGLSDLSPLYAKGPNNTQPDRSEWKSTSNHYITRGVPLDAFPWGQMRVAGFEIAGDVLLKTSQGAPVLAVRNVGKGRVVAFSYHERGLIPDIENVFETGLHYPYHEYLWSLAARAVVWAAAREPGPAIQKIDRWNVGVFGLDLYDNFIAAYDYQADHGVICYANRQLARGVKTWTWGTGEAAKRQMEHYTDSDGPYLEVQSGRFVWDGNYEFIEPGKTDGWTEYWYGTGGLGGLTTATRDAAISLDFVGKDHRSVKLAVRSTGRFPHVTLKLKAGEVVIWTSQKDLSPENVLREQIEIKPEIAGRALTLEALAANGSALIKYIAHPDGAHPDAVFASDSIPRRFGTIENLTAEEAFQKGLAHEKFGEMEDARQAYEAALSKDRLSTQPHLRLGVIALERLQHEEEGLFRALALLKEGKKGKAEAWLKNFTLSNERNQKSDRAVARAQAFYLAGVYAAFQGQTEQARKSFNKCLEIDRSQLWAQQALGWLEAGLLKNLAQ